MAEYLVEYVEGSEVTYFCSDIRLDALPSILEENNIKVHEVEAYQTKFDAIKLPKTVKGVMFYSPSTVKSYKQENDKTAEDQSHQAKETSSSQAQEVIHRQGRLQETIPSCNQNSLLG